MDTESDRLNSPEIVDLTPENIAAIEQTAKLLMDGFRRRNSRGWPAFDEAIAEVRDSLSQDRISRVPWMAVVRFWVGLVESSSTAGMCGDFILWSLTISA